MEVSAALQAAAEVAEEVAEEVAAAALALALAAALAMEAVEAKAALEVATEEAGGRTALASGGRVIPMTTPQAWMMRSGHTSLQVLSGSAGIRESSEQSATVGRITGVKQDRAPGKGIQGR